jgi:hypothetical protein
MQEFATTTDPAELKRLNDNFIDLTLRYWQM